MKPSLSSILHIAFGGILFSLPAWLNGFPFVFPDSGDYLTFHPLLYRSPYYGLFIFFFHLNRFIWLPVMAQCLIISHLLWLLMRLMLGKDPVWRFILLAILLTLVSSLPFFTGFIMADIFTPIMFLAMYIVAFYYRWLSKPLLIYLIGLNCVATAAHISNPTLGVGLIILFIALKLMTRDRLAGTLSPLMLLGGSIITTLAAVLLFNVAIFGAWSLSPASQSFLMANLIQYGPARDYLRQSCPAAGYKICAYTHEVPATANELLWSSGLYDKLGSFPGMQDEARQIVKETIRTHPAEVVRMLVHNFGSGLVTHEPAYEFQKDFQVASFAGLIDKKFGAKALVAYEASAEMRDTIPHATIKAVDDIACPASFAVLLLLTVYAWRKTMHDAFALAAATICFVLGDTFLCTALSGVHERYQARVTWLMPMVCVVILFALSNRRRTTSSEVETHHTLSHSST